MTLVELARDRAEAAVLSNGSSLGLLAAAKAYRQVWTRDAMICGLGLMLARNRDGAEVHRRSLATLREHQSRLGNIPNNVGFPGHDPAYVIEGRQLTAAPGADPAAAIVDTSHAGSIDNSLWYVLGHFYAWSFDRDHTRLAESWSSLERAYLWLQYQDSNECGLLEAHESMDWADLFSNRYNSLLPNVLWFAVQRAMAAMASALGHAPEAARFRAAAEDVRFRVNQLLWVGPEVARDRDWIANHRKEWLYPTRAVDVLLQERPYFLPYMAYKDWCDRFDTFGNLAAIVFGLADAAQTTRIFDFISGAGLAEPWPIAALAPVVQPGDRDWREYFRIRNLNLPHQYHNGGAWPFLGGFYVAALVKAGRRDEAARQLERLAEMNRRSRHGEEWEFNEWFHGQSGKPMGFAGQSWSAAMYLFAHECVRRGTLPVFDADNGW